MICEFLNIMAQASDVEPVSLFPFPWQWHLVFSIVALIFFVARYISEKHIYQLIFAAAIPISMLIHVSDNKFPFYAVGIVEGILLVIAFIAYIFRKKAPSDEESES